jgi:hypothetical protein
MSDKGVPKLIQCGDHKWAPWAIICCHLMDNPEDHEWCPIEVNDGREVDNDYVCPECFEAHFEQGEPHDIDKLRAVCIHCLRHLHEKAPKS